MKLFWCALIASRKNDARASHSTRHNNQDCGYVAILFRYRKNIAEPELYPKLLPSLDLIPVFFIQL
jgi:hypothetical protein